MVRTKPVIIIGAIGCAREADCIITDVTWVNTTMMTNIVLAMMTGSEAVTVYDMPLVA